MSDIPTVLAGVAAAFAAVTPSRLEVIVGSAFDPAKDAVTVGFGGDDNEPSADVTCVPFDAGQTSFRWLYEVPCTLALHEGAWGENGDVDVSLVARDALNSYRTALRSAELEEGQMRPPYLSRIQWLPVSYDDGGVTQIVRFWVHVESLDIPEA